MSRRRIASVVTALVMTALLAGCVSIPTSGDVVGAEIAQEQPDGDVTYLVRGPQPGQTQEEILQGFITAGLGPQDGYQVAKQFLAPEFATDWNPTARVVVSQRRGAPVRQDAETISVSVAVDAEVDAVGTYSPARTPTTERMRFGFAEVDGEWRISSAPDGTVVSSGSFRTLFSAYPVYFDDPSGDFLVPDLRWFPRLPTPSSRMVRAILDGPGTWLSGAVSSAFPEETLLTSPVTVEDGTATVDLSSEVLTQDAAAKRRMLRQLTATLTGLDEVRAVEVSVREFPVDMGSAEGAQAAAEPEVESAPLVYADGDFGFAEGGGAIRRLSGISGAVESLEPTAAALGRDGEAAAVRTGAGVFLVRDGEAVLVDDRAGLAPPSLDPHGVVWSVPTEQPRQILAVGPGGVERIVANGLPADARVTALETSRDGARLLIGLRRGSGVALAVAAIIRDDELAPVRLGPLMPLPSGSGQVVDAAWVDATTVAALAVDSEGSHVRVAEIGGVDSGFGDTTSATELTGGDGGPAGIRLLDAEGALLRPSGSGGWRTIGPVASFLATQH